MNKKILITIILIVIIGIAGFFATRQKGQPLPLEEEVQIQNYANPIAEKILVAFKENDYEKFSENFTEKMKNNMPQEVFSETGIMVKSKIGDYISKSFWKIEKEGFYVVVYYKAKFTEEPSDVIVKVVLETYPGPLGDKMLVGGLWFDSPKLRGE